MLFLLFQAGEERYALEARQVVEVVPSVAVRPLPTAPAGVTGFFNYRGGPVVALDLCRLLNGRPSRDSYSTRIIVLRLPDGTERGQFVGLLAENATTLLRKDPADFHEPVPHLRQGGSLGPVLLDERGHVQWLRDQRLLADSARQVPPANVP
jgi:chemotaxis-related protein WspB